MSRGIDRLFDLMVGQSQWTTTGLVKVPTTEEMTIAPDTPNGPMLQISKKDADGVVVYVEKLNLPAVDDLIGRLIKMRDHLATIMEKHQ